MRTMADETEDNIMVQQSSSIKMHVVLMTANFVLMVGKSLMLMILMIK
jgi:hypothetical protein